MATIDIVEQMQKAVNNLYKQTQSQFDQYHKLKVKYELLKSKYGSINLNEHQQRELSQLQAQISDIESEVESEIKPFTNEMFDRLQIVNSSSDINNMQHMVILRNILNCLDQLNTSEFSGLEELQRELKLSVDSLVSQIETESNRSPRLFAKKPDGVQTDLHTGNQKILEISNILNFANKSDQAFQSKIGVVNENRFDVIMKLASQKIELLESIMPDLKKIYQHLKSDDIDHEKLAEQVGEVMGVLKTVMDLPGVQVPSGMTSGIARIYNFSWVSLSYGEIDHSLSGGDELSLRKAIEALMGSITNLTESSISAANKVSSDFISQLVSENETNVKALGAMISDFFTKNDSLVQVMPKDLYDVINMYRNAPAVTNKEASKIWSDYKIWYSKLEDGLREIIDFLKMYYSIKTLYPLTIGLRTLDAKGRDVDNNAYVASMQEILNEALDKGKKMATSKKALVAKLFKFYPNDERIARAYYRIFDNVQSAW